MGASLIDLQTILRLRKDGFLPDRFSVADVGAQQLSNDVLRDPSILPAYAEAFGVPLKSFGSAPARNDKPGVEHLPADAPFTKGFWEWLGCPYVAIDYDQSPHIIPLDLNFDDVPAEHAGRYQLVTNFGTTEHVANQFQAMKVIHDLTSPGGVMMHTVPTQGYLMHGMISYSPKFFQALARSCRYDIHEIIICSDEGNTVLPLSNPEAVLNHYRTHDACLLAVMRKREAIQFVPPIEIHAGVVDDPKIKSRYWTVFE